MPVPVPSNRRMPLSCEPCRQRKIKCPRNISRGRAPCDTCVRRGIPADECIYLRDQWAGRNAPMPRYGDNSALVARIDRLEELLRQSVSSANSEPRKPEPEPESEPASDLLSPESTLHQSTTSLSTHSDTSFTETCSSIPPAGVIIRNESGHDRFEPASLRWSPLIQDNPKTDMDEGKPGSIPFSTTNATVNDLLELLPPASHCEELKKVFFDTFAPLFHILHDPTFEADYRRFESDPEKVSLPWLALLFSILGIAVIALPEDSPLFRELGKRNSTPDNMSLLISRYRGAAMKCLEADHYLWRHNLNTLQALVILIYGINHTHGQSWALLGAARNIALSLGCHVDPEVFQMDLIRVEERRRCWAGVNMLYTIQNTTLGMLDVTHTPTTVRLPLDVNDDELVAGYQIPQSREGPTQMSYLLLKFELYDICTRICSHVFETSQTTSYDKVQALDAEISAMQETFNYKYLFDVGLVAHHAVQLNILFGYTHQLTLFLHRPILRQGVSRCTPENWLRSQNRCIESSKALLDIHRTLYKDPAFRPYHWYNRGLGSFHAFHAAVCLAHICMSSTNLDASTKASLQELVRDSLQVFRYFMNTGVSAICTKAMPVLEKLLNLMDTQESRESSRATEPAHKQPDLCHQNELGLLDEYIENLAPQQWLSPSNMGWEGWAMILEDDSMASVF